MTGYARRGPIPDELGWLVDWMSDAERRLREIETPDSAQNFQTVPKLAKAIDDLAVLVSDLDARLDDYLATGAASLIAAEVATQLAAALAGDVVIGGNLTAAGIATTDHTATGSRFVVWSGPDGRLGHT